MVSTDTFPRLSKAVKEVRRVLKLEGVKCHISALLPVHYSSSARFMKVEADVSSMVALCRERLGPFRDTWRGTGGAHSFVLCGKRFQDSSAEQEWRRRIVSRMEALADPEIQKAEVEAVGVRVYTLFHAVGSLDIARSICSSKFASISSLDPGWYGHGVYFSDSLDYVVEQYGKWQDNKKYVIAANMVVGHPLPVLSSERWKGSALAPAYDAHVTFVKRYGTEEEVRFPARPEEWAGRETAMEMVVNDNTTILCRAIIEVTRG